MYQQTCRVEPSRAPRECRGDPVSRSSNDYINLPTKFLSGKLLFNFKPYFWFCFLFLVDFVNVASLPGFPLLPCCFVYENYTHVCIAWNVEPRTRCDVYIYVP